MMISAPDTPYGAATIQFWQIFTRRPLNLPRLQEAFATLATLAVQEHPDSPWPGTLDFGNGQLIPFTVEALLARKSEMYANSPSVPDSTVQELLVRWDGLTIKEVLAGWQGAGFQLSLAKKSRTQVLGNLGVSCSWQLRQEQTVLCSSTDTDLHIAESLRTLKGKSLLTSHLGPKGHLVLGWKTGYWLEIQPDELVISPDYHLDFGWDDEQLLLYYRFAGAFVAFEQSTYGEQDIIDKSF
jgi:hypothetical protein